LTHRQFCHKRRNMLQHYHCLLQVGDYVQKTFHLTMTDHQLHVLLCSSRYSDPHYWTTLSMSCHIPLIYNVCMYVRVRTRVHVYIPNVSIRISKPSVNYNVQHTGMFHYILYVNIFLLRYFNYCILFSVIIAICFIFYHFYFLYSA
jgi:hypothetical protein